VNSTVFVPTYILTYILTYSLTYSVTDVTHRGTLINTIHAHHCQAIEDFSSPPSVWAMISQAALTTEMKLKSTKIKLKQNFSQPPTKMCYFSFVSASAHMKQNAETNPNSCCCKSSNFELVGLQCIWRHIAI